MVKKNKNKFYNCGSLRKENIGETVKLRGWIKKKRAVKNKIFIDVYDMHGVTQLLLLESNNDNYCFAKVVTDESVVQVKGEVLLRKNKNTLLKTGEIEVLVEEIKLLNNNAKNFPIDLNNAFEEEVFSEKNLRFRYLFLRHLQVKANLVFKHKVLVFLRDFFQKNNFLEIETPILSRSYPEGAREFRVFSEKSNVEKYTLAQSPQIFKQLLMVGGFERYYQIAKCFRDEKLRSDRQPEFLQLDFEINFTDESEIFSIVRKLFSFLWKKNKQEKRPKFKVISYKKAINDYGIDKPDLRNDKKLRTIFEPKLITLFGDKIPKKPIVKFIVFAKKIDNFFKIFINKLLFEHEKTVSCFFWEKSSQTFFCLRKHKQIKNNFEVKGINDPFGLFFVGEIKAVNLVAGLVRNELVRLSFLPHQKKFSFVWIKNWPMFLFDEEKQIFSVAHHPFTALKQNQINTKKENLLASSYDLVINGYEVGSGSIRNHNADEQIKIFKMLGFSQKKLKEFSFFTEALKYGCPPHGGFALGIDRLLIIMNNKITIKEMIAFPKNSSGVCEMTKKT